jgi:CRISPR-associated protein (TIGR03986 family)
MPGIPSPYNFVPLSEKVVFPDWRNKVSMDVPFSDAINGSIEIEVKAVTPIYIRNGGEHPDKEQRHTNDEYKDFFRIYPEAKDKYAIPGTSFKGMLRNVIEIASFGKMQNVNDNRYAFRDLGGSMIRIYGDKMTRRKVGGFEPKVKAAWLDISDKNVWKIKTCEFARVEQSDIKRYFNDVNFFSGNGDDKTAKLKYLKANGMTQVWFNAGCYKNQTERHRVGLWYSLASDLAREKQNDEQQEGSIVFTGQPGRQKHMEFIFYKKDVRDIEIPVDITKDFIFVHEGEKPSPDWLYWKSRKCEIPVFVLPKEGKTEIKTKDDIEAFGLAMMFRLPYKLSIKETIGHTSMAHFSGEPDLAETIFGSVASDGAKKGRVSVGTLISDGTEKKMAEVTTVLGTPKASYFPNYLEQDNPVNEYKTYMDEEPRVRGWKRYFPSSGGTRELDAAPALDVATKFVPLDKGAIFKGKIFFHNIKSVELGAILWALDFGGKKRCLHQIGLAKPFGYGSISVKVCGMDLKPVAGRNAKNQELYVKDFTDMMEKECGNQWANSKQILSLLEIADATKISDGKHTGFANMEIRYPVLRMQGPNEFANYKRSQISLASLSGGADVKAGPIPKKAANKEDLFDDFRSWFDEIGKKLQPNTQNQIILKLQALTGDDLVAGKAMVKAGFGKNAMANPLKDFLKG